MRTPRSHPIAAVTALVLLALALTACGDSSTTASDTTTQTTAPQTTTPSAEGGAGSQSVKIVDFAYSPPDLTVPSGTTVTFANSDEAPHTATSKQSGAFDTGTIDGGKRGQVTLSDPGTYAYYCAFHPFMKGTVTVE